MRSGRLQRPNPPPHGLARPSPARAYDEEQRYDNPQVPVPEAEIAPPAARSWDGVQDPVPLWRSEGLQTARGLDARGALRLRDPQTGGGYPPLAEHDRSPVHRPRSATGREGSAGCSAGPADQGTQGHLGSLPKATRSLVVMKPMACAFTALQGRGLPSGGTGMVRSALAPRKVAAWAEGRSAAPTDLDEPFCIAGTPACFLKNFIRQYNLDEVLDIVSLGDLQTVRKGFRPRGWNSSSPLTAASDISSAGGANPPGRRRGEGQFAPPPEENYFTAGGPTSTVFGRSIISNTPSSRLVAQRWPSAVRQYGAQLT